MNSENAENKQALSPEESQAGMDTFFAEPAEKSSAPAKSRKLTQNTMMLIGSIAALLLVGGVLTTVLILNSVLSNGESSGDAENGTEAVTEEKEMALLNPMTADALVDVQVKNTSEFTMLVKQPESEEEETGYLLKGFESLDVDTSLLSTLANNGCELYADSVVEENASDLKKYGLETPAADVVLEYADGTKFAMQVGDASPLDKSYTYCAVDGSVYLVKTSLVTNYRRERDDFITKTMLEKPADDAYPIVNSLRVQRKDLEYDIYMEYYYKEDDGSVGGTAATHVLQEPIFAYLDVSHSTDVTNGMFGLTASKIMAVYPTEADLEQAGISEPFCTVTMATDDGMVRILNFGNSFTGEDGSEYYPAYLNGGQVLYAVSAENAVWTTLQPEDIISANIFVTNVWNISTLDVKAGDIAMKFDGEGDKDTYEVKKNGVDCDTERFRLFYKFLLFIYGENFCLDEPLPAREPDAAVHVMTQDGKEDYTVSFYRLDTMKTMVAVDDVPVYSIRTSCLDTLKHNMEIFDDMAQDFRTTWQ